MDTEFVHQFWTETGFAVRVRPMQPGDAVHLVDLFEHMGTDSRYMRFNLPLTDPDPDWVAQEAARLADVDPEKGAAWLAFADLPGEPAACVGGIRYILGEDGESAEVALVVRDDLHGQGIGTELIRFAGISAYLRGVRRLVGVVQSRNIALWHTLDNLSVPVERRLMGPLTEVAVTLDESLLADSWEQRKP